MNTKKCKTCKLDKELIQFQKRKLSNDGLDLHCKDCKSEYIKEYRKEKRTSEKIKLESINWPRNKDTRKKWKTLNKDKNNKRRRSIIENYTEEEYIIFRQKINENKKNRRSKDPVYKLKCNISTRLSKALKKINENKSDIKSIDTIGCDILHLKKYLESRFETWMI